MFGCFIFLQVICVLFLLFVCCFVLDSLRFVPTIYRIFSLLIFVLFSPIHLFSFLLLWFLSFIFVFLLLFVCFLFSIHLFSFINLIRCVFLLLIIWDQTFLQRPHGKMPRSEGLSPDMVAGKVLVFLKRWSCTRQSQCVNRVC